MWPWPDKAEEARTWTAALLAAGVPALFPEWLCSADATGAHRVGDQSLWLFNAVDRRIEVAKGEPFERWAGKPVFILYMPVAATVVVMAEQRFYRVSGECGVEEDFGADFRMVLADLLIELLEDHECTPAQLAAWSARVGFAEGPRWQPTISVTPPTSTTRRPGKPGSGRSRDCSASPEDGSHRASDVAAAASDRQGLWVGPEGTMAA